MRLVTPPKLESQLRGTVEAQWQNECSSHSAVPQVLLLVHRCEGLAPCSCGANPLQLIGLLMVTVAGFPRKETRIMNAGFPCLLLPCILKGKHYLRKICITQREMQKQQGRILWLRGDLKIIPRNGNRSQKALLPGAEVRLRSRLRSFISTHL